LGSLRDIRKRIASVKKTQQITRAMRMVAAAKLRRAQDAIMAARPYADRMHGTLAEVARRQKGATHPLLEVRQPVQRLELVLITSDRGLCGSLNSASIKLAERVLAEREGELESISLSLIGRKGRDYFRRRRAQAIREALVGLGSVDYRLAVEVAAGLARRYAAGEIDEAIVLYSEFRSALSQPPLVERVLPVVPGEVAEPGEEDVGAPYSFEPNEQALLQALVPKALEVEIHRALLESQASEHAARMTAMESATRNTQEMIDRLTLQFNRARQAAITKELVEIITGAEAL
jgi:F-type H+-transporting ATPase subunit gamma